MPPVIVKYPLDSTGVNPANLVTHEPKTLTTTPVRVICTNYGAFYSESVVVRDLSNNRTLVQGRDYYCAWLYQSATDLTGLEVCALIVITDTTCGTNVDIDYQALGGEFSYSYDAIVQMIDALNLDNRPVAWGNILDKPDAFPPAPHLHDIGDVYGFEYLVQSIQVLAQTISLGSAAGEKAFYTYVDNAVALLNTALSALQANQNSRDAIIASLGYIPVDPANAEFTALVKFDAGMYINGPVLEDVIPIQTTGVTTIIDLSLGTIFLVTLSNSTNFVFDTTKIANLQPNTGLSFTFIVVNAADNLAIAFNSPIEWANKAIPPRTMPNGGRDEYYFSTLNSGSFYSGSLSIENAG